MKQSRIGPIYKLLYNPDMPDSLLNKLIKRSPCVKDDENEINQYNVDYFISDLKEEKYKLNKEEKEFLAELLTQEIDYIEI